VVFSEFPHDPRPRREAEALIDAGMSVDMICLRGEGQPAQETDKGINVHRINLKRTRHSKLLYILQYGYFIFLAFLRLSFQHLRQRYHVVHVHNMPDVLVFCALLPRLTGARVILDLHDPMTEIFITRYGITESHVMIRVLKSFEKLSIGFAHLVLTPNIAFREKFITRGCPEEKIHIVMNSPQENIFNDSNLRDDKKSNQCGDILTLMYHGYVSEYNGLDVAIKAVSYLKRQIPEVVLKVYGDGPYLDYCRNVAKEFDVVGHVEFNGITTLENISKHIKQSDIGIIPNKSTPFTNCNMPTRIFEYLSLRRPVVCSRTKGVLDYFKEDELCFYNPGCPHDLAGVVKKIHKSRSYTSEIVDKGYQVYKRHRWNNEKQYFVDLVKKQVSKNCSLASYET
jgi:glycosyltransferase involved in cell wall biosynthesis